MTKNFYLILVCLPPMCNIPTKLTNTKRQRLILAINIQCRDATVYGGDESFIAIRLGILKRCREFSLRQAFGEVAHCGK